MSVVLFHIPLLFFVYVSFLNISIYKMRMKPDSQLNVICWLPTRHPVHTQSSGTHERVRSSFHKQRSVRINREKWTLTFTIIVMVFNEQRTCKQIQIITRCTASSSRSQVCHRRFICACVVWEFEADDIRLVFRGHTWTWKMSTDNGWRLSSTSSLCIWLTHSFTSSLTPSGTFLIIHHTRINQHSCKVNCRVRLSGNLPIPAAVSTVHWPADLLDCSWTMSCGSCERAGVSPDVCASPTTDL